MSTDQPADTSLYQVVVNQEGQYSLWFADRELPPGWSAAGMSGTKDECLAYVEEVWTDMTPVSLRRKESDTT
jgi:MbtH protein